MIRLKSVMNLQLQPQLLLTLYLLVLQTSLHGSCPVSKGEKWVATKWIRDQEQE